MADLPDELWDACIDQLSLDIPSLTLASLVSRSWCKRARLHLFRHINLYTVHSLGRTQAFIRLLATKEPAQCTFLHALRSVSLYQFDALSLAIKSPKRFLRKTLDALMHTTNIKKFGIFYEYWCRSHTLTVSSGFNPSGLTSVTVSRCKFTCLIELSRSISLLQDLEELILNVDILPSPEAKRSQPSPLPATLRRLTVKSYIPQKTQVQVYGWIASIPPPQLEYLWINPSRDSLKALAHMMAAFRSSLKELFVRPEYRQDCNICESANTTVLADDVSEYAIGKLGSF